MSRPDDDAWFRAWVEASRWRFAKTYVTTYPHEYALAAWGEPDAFRRAISCIERWGEVETFLDSRRKYLHLDERKYWHMGDAASDDPNKRPGLINRSWLDVARYCDEARALGHDGEALERLVGRWRSLLERARRGPKDRTIRTGVEP